MPRSALTTLSFLVVLGLARPVAAGDVVIEDMDIDEGNVAALLEQTSQYYVDAMRRLVNVRYQDEYRAIRWEDLETAMTNTRLARFEYHYTVGSQQLVRIYHAMDGEPLGAIGRSIFEGPTRPGTPSTPDMEWNEDELAAVSLPETTIDRLAIDAEDSQFFTAFDEVETRARILSIEDSVLRPRFLSGKDRSLDAELKALRQIEHDIKNRVVPAGGRIDGKVGGLICPSCEDAMRDMARTYDVEVRATQMYRTVPYNTQKSLLDAGKARMTGQRLLDAASGRPLLAHDLLDAARAAQVRQNLSPRAMGRSFKGMLWHRRSFQLGPVPMQRLSESPEDRLRPSNPDAEDAAPPQC